jgi:poly(A) polymerase
MIPPRLAGLVGPGTDAALLADLFLKADKQLFLVGGSVRDAFMGRTDASPDLDFTTDAHPEEIKEIVDSFGAVYTIGESFGTIAVHRNHTDYEITTFRREIYRDKSRKPEVSFSDNIEEDLGRRDFTVNAMALRLGEDPELIDPYGGLGDLATGTLRTPIGPKISFSDDPLRMLRLFRFMATIKFSPTEAAIDAVINMANRLSIVSAERIRGELDKLLVGANVVEALRLMTETGLADQFLPELSLLKMQVDPGQHHKDVFEHTLAVVAKTSPKPRLRLAALLHDIGKPETRAFEPLVTFHHHEVVGARMARARMRALKYAKQEVRDVGQLVFLHLRPHTFKMGWTDSAVRRYVRDAGELLEDLNELVRCDVTTKNQKRARVIERSIDELEARIVVLRAKEEIEALRPPIDGTQVMAFLHLKPGRQVGEIMKRLLEYRIDHGPFDDNEAYGLIGAWADELELTIADPFFRPTSAKDDDG